LAKESEIIGQRSRADELAGRLSNEESTRAAALRGKLELEKQIEGLREQLGAQQASLRAFQDRLAASEADKSRLQTEKTELERLSTAQAAQVQSTQEAIEATRLQLARETQTAKILQNAREQAEKALAAQRTELARIKTDLDECRQSSLGAKQLKKGGDGDKTA
jgi:chromosome segregation ATPase